MRYDGTHLHNCQNTAAGCKGQYPCSDEYLERNHDPDGVVCWIDPLSEGECELCATSRCSDCGHIIALEAHEDDCPKATAV